MAKLAYQRVLLKISGERFQGQRQSGIDPEFLKWLSNEIDQIVSNGAEVVIVVGAGNIMRGESFARHGMDRVTGDYMGMLATIINGMALAATLEQIGHEARMMTRLHASSVAEPYIHRRALNHLKKGRIVIIGGGTGSPYFTTDTAAVLGAVELQCQAMLKATNVDGVFDKDPHEHEDAKMFSHISYQDALNGENIRVMDKTALAMAAENDMPVVVFNLLKPGNIEAVIRGEKVGTKVT